MEKKLTKLNYLYQGIVFVLLLIIDQVTKVLARNNLSDGKSVYLIKKVLCFHYLENRGSVWGILQGRINFLLIVSLLLFAVLTYVYIKLPKENKYLPLLWIDVFMIAGAIGNTIDRIVFGYVTDFIYVEIINFPIFNFADCCITIAAVLTIIMILTKYKDDNFSFFSFRKKNEIKENGETDTDN
ncbi:MAG: signal peptidase II [Lachnospiraceae bacterium]|nr:signal peptidase II [Lachnospiraceae bacterium]